jgi:cytochrome c oxidase subunit 2
MNTRDAFGQVFTMEAAIAGGVFAAVALVVAFAVVRYRDRPGSEPSHRGTANVLESCFALALLGFAIWLTVDTASANSRETAAAPSSALHVDVLAYQWSWQFTYPDQRITVNGAALGSRPTLVVPVDRSIEVSLRSKDVIHEFWVPELRFKKQAFPGYTNTFSLKVTRTGTWVGRCAVYCGPFHYQMDFLLKAVTPAQFAAWTAAHHGSTVSAGSAS